MATKPNAALPKTRPRLRGEPDHQEPAESRQPIDIIRLASLCLTGLLIGVNDITYPPPPRAASLESFLVSSARTIFPFTVACILAAAFLDPIVRCARFPPSSILALASLLIAGAHASALTLPSSWSQTVPCAVLRHLLLGVGNTLSLTIATLSSSRTTTLGLLHGTAALGAVLRTAVAASTTADSRATMMIPGRKGQHLAVLVLGLATAASLLPSPRPDRHGAGECGRHPKGPMHGDTETQTHRTHTPQPAPPPPASRPEKPLHRETNAQYPPPASRITTLTALLALAHHGTLVALPAGLVSLSPSVGEQKHIVHVAAAAFWTGVAISRFFMMLPPRREQHIRAKQAVVSRAVLVAAGCFLLLLSCWLFLTWGMAGHTTAAAAAVVGFMLGPVYPWVVGVFKREMDEDEALSGVGIVVAFGYAGEMLALLTVQLVAHLGAPVVMYVVIAGLVGGMLVCWKALIEDEGGEAGAAPGVDV